MVATVGYTKFKPGTKVHLRLKDGRTLEGRYVDTRQGCLGLIGVLEDGREGFCMIPKRLIAFVRKDGA